MTSMLNGYIKETDTTRKPFRTARRLGSGDICIMVANEEEATALREHKEWVKKLSGNARTTIKTYGIFLHGVRSDMLYTKDKATAFKKLEGPARERQHSESRYCMDGLVRSSWIRHN